MSPHTCYLLEFKDEWGDAKSYHGMTEVRYGQDQQEACAVRFVHHKRMKLTYMESAVWDTATIQYVGPMLSLQNALAQEAINAATALGKDTSARGACWSCKELNGFLRNSALMVRRAVKGRFKNIVSDSLGFFFSHPMFVCAHPPSLSKLPLFCSLSKGWTARQRDRLSLITRGLSQTSILSASIWPTRSTRTKWAICRGCRGSWLSASTVGQGSLGARRELDRLSAATTSRTAKGTDD